MPALDELRQFHEFVGRQLLASQSIMTPEECLEAWRRRHPSPASVAASVADLESALEDMERGDLGVPAREFVQSLREKLGSANSP